MKSLLKLIHFEVNRFRHFLFGLMGLTAIVQIGFTILFAYGERVERMPGPARDPDPIKILGPTSMLDLLAGHYHVYVLPVLFCIVALLLYVFLIWYRDWFGRSSFIYRLLSLPSPRRHLYLAKLAALLMFIGSLLALQLALLMASRGIFNAIVPAEYRSAVSFADMINANPVFRVLLPLSFEHFLLYYGMGVTCVLVVFNTVLLERSRRPVGLILAIVHAAGMAVLLMGTVTARVAGAHEFLHLYAYEFTWILAGIWVLAAAFSVWLGFRLLNRDVSV